MSELNFSLVLCVYIYDVILFFHNVFYSIKYKNKDNIMGKDLAILIKEYESSWHKWITTWFYWKKRLRWKKDVLVLSAIYVKQNGEVEEISQCYISCSEDLKFKVKCEFQEFCCITLWIWKVKSQGKEMS